MPFLRQSTAQTIRFGPCLDITDGVTEETALTLAQADMRLSKDGGAFAQKSAAGNATHDSDGWYSTSLSTTDTNTVGELILNVHQPANMLPVWMRWWVLEEDIYDALFGASAAGFDTNQRVDVGEWLGTAVTTSATTSKPEVDVNSISDDATAANNAELFFDGTGYAGGTTPLNVNVTQISGDATAADNAELFFDNTGFNASNSTIGTCTTNTDMRGTDSALLASSAPTNFGDLAITVTTGQVTVGTNNDKSGYSLAADQSGVTVGTVNTLTGHTAQTGDSFARLGAPAGASVSADIAALNDISAADVNAQCDTAISDAGLNLATETRNKTLVSQIQTVIATVEHQRGAHTHQPIGNIFFVDPVNGDTHANGNRGGISDPYAGVQDCHDNAVTDSNHDMIILLSGAAAGATTLTEDVTLSKRYLFIRGPGRDFIWTRGTNGDTITITADGIELAGFQLNTAGTGSGNGCTVTSADFFRAYGLWINDTQGHGIQLTNVDNAVIQNNHFHDTGQSGSGHGLVLDAATGQSGDSILIEGNHFHGVQGDCVRLNPTGTGTVNDAVISDNHFINATGDGVDLTGANVNRASIFNNVFGVITGSDVNDNGTDTVSINNEQWSTLTAAQVNAEVVDALATDTYAEPGQGAPGATISLAAKLNYLYKWTRNQKDNDGSTTQFYADNASTVDQKQTTSEAAGTVTKGEIASGP